MNRKISGFSLVELIVVMAIIAIMVAMFTGAINPIAQMNRANDTKRKKDLARIKVSFEEYYNDKGCYPRDELADLMNANNCGGGIFRPWLNSWPCDPTKRTPYRIEVEDSTCPDWFKIFVSLENDNDNSIPVGWNEGMEIYLTSEISSEDVNYGVSSTNVLWYEDYRCEVDTCLFIQGSCQEAGTCYGNNCYKGACLPQCKCPNGCSGGHCN